jgi:hypothetical protein
MQRCPCCCNNEGGGAVQQQRSTPSTFITRQRLSDDAIIFGLTTLFTLITMTNWWLFAPGV